MDSSFCLLGLRRRLAPPLVWSKHARLMTFFFFLRYVDWCPQPIASSLLPTSQIEVPEFTDKFPQFSSHIWGVPVRGRKFSVGVQSSTLPFSPAVRHLELKDFFFSVGHGLVSSSTDLFPRRPSAFVPQAWAPERRCFSSLFGSPRSSRRCSVLHQNSLRTLFGVPGPPRMP